MWRIALKSALARKFRFLSTALAVMLGVAFLAGSLVLLDTIGKTFDDLFAEIGKGVDVEVRSAEKLAGPFGDVRGSVDASVLDDVKAVQGVAAADGNVNGFAQLVGKDGKPMGNPGQGAPVLGFAWSAVPELNPMRLVGAQSRPPGPGEVVIDRASAKRGPFAVGDTVTILLKGPPEPFVISGIATFGNADSPLGATVAVFDHDTAQRVLAEPGRYDYIDVVAEDGVNPEALRQRVAAAVDGSLEVITGKALIKENQSIAADALGFFNTFMLVFAVIALFVGSFIIYNTFSIVVAQRSREMALLRALGATSGQVLRSVQLEALLVGVFASLIGLAAGVGVATALKALLAGFGIDIPSGGVVFATRTVVLSLVVGIGITLLSAVVPALRAARTPPMLAIREAASDRSAHSLVRTVIGSVVTAFGIAAGLYGLFGASSSAMLMVGAGAMATFFGVAVLGPVLARPVSAVLGVPLRRFRGFAGLLAAENAQRNPKRTSATAAALMIGVGLVGFITIFAASGKASINKLVDDSFLGDIVVDARTGGQGGISPEFASRLNALPEVEAASGVRLGFAEIDGKTEVVYGVDPRTMDRIVDVGIIEGTLADLGPTEIAVLDEKAEQEGWTIGTEVPIRFAQTGTKTFRVALLYTEKRLAGTYFMGYPAFEANFRDSYDFQVYVNTNPSVPVEQARAAVETVAGDFPNANVQDLSEFKATQAAQINQLLGLIYALLALSIGIALIGIANTLALSVVERTHELGLLRAVGLTRRQLRSAIRWEAVIIALFGAVLGLTVGIFFGWAVVGALKDEGFSRLVVPVGQLAIVAVIAALVGVLAAIGPARRAARLDVLRAIAAD